jgi:hypothetical protein
MPVDTTDTILIGATPLEAIGTVETLWEGAFGVEYSDDQPDLPGESLPAFDLVPRPRQVNIGMLIHGDTRAEFLDRLHTLEQLVDQPLATLDLRKQQTVDVTTETWTKRAKFVGGVDPTMVGGSNRIGRVLLRFATLDAAWHSVSSTSTNVTSSGATVASTGRRRTHRITITLPGAGTLTNTTTGHALVTTGVATVDAQWCTATNGGSNVLGRILGSNFVDGHIMALVPGNNTFTWTAAGTVVVEHWDAT